MNSNFSKKPIALALGAAFAMNGLATQAGSPSSDKLFQASDLPSGYTQLAEGKCGEGKCGGEMKTATGAKPADAKATEGKCGEGKCGAEMFDKMDTNKDGKLTRDEFMAGHKAMEGKCGEGKCGEGKCGAKK